MPISKDCVRWGIEGGHHFQSVNSSPVTLVLSVFVNSHWTIGRLDSSIACHLHGQEPSVWARASWRHPKGGMFQHGIGKRCFASRLNRLISQAPGWTELKSLGACLKIFTIRDFTYHLIPKARVWLITSYPLSRRSRLAKKECLCRDCIQMHSCYQHAHVMFSKKTTRENGSLKLHEPRQTIHIFPWWARILDLWPPSPALRPAYRITFIILSFGTFFSTIWVQITGARKKYVKYLNRLNHESLLEKSWFSRLPFAMSCSKVHALEFVRHLCVCVCGRLWTLTLLFFLCSKKSIEISSRYHG